MRDELRTDRAATQQAKGWVERACRHCGTVARRPPSKANRPYCSEACFFAHIRTPERVCAGCHRPYRKPGRGHTRPDRFCSMACYNRFRRPATARCPVCRKRFPAPEWGRRRFCSHGCANRGRARPPNAADRARNQHIVELRQAGYLVKQIKRQLDAQQPPPGVSEAGIYKILSRAGVRRRQGPARRSEEDAQRQEVRAQMDVEAARPRKVHRDA